MIFLTNKFDVFAVILRNTVTKLILKNGIAPKYLKMLKKIYSFEALISDESVPVSIKKFSTELLYYVYIKKRENNSSFYFFVSIKGNFIINKKAFLSLILSLSQKASFLSIKGFKNGIVVKCDKFKMTKHFKLIIKKLNATYFYDIKRGIVNILLFPTMTDKKSDIIAKDRDKFHGPLSVTDCYLTQ